MEMDDPARRRRGSFTIYDNHMNRPTGDAALVRHIARQEVEMDDSARRRRGSFTMYELQQGLHDNHMNRPTGNAAFRRHDLGAINDRHDNLAAVFKASSASSIHHTISKDRTKGNDAAQASLLADCYQKARPKRIAASTLAHDTARQDDLQPVRVGRGYYDDDVIFLSGDHQYNGRKPRLRSASQINEVDAEDGRLDDFRPSIDLAYDDVIYSSNNYETGNTRLTVLPRPSVRINDRDLEVAERFSLNYDAAKSITTAQGRYPGIVVDEDSFTYRVDRGSTTPSRNWEYGRINIPSLPPLPSRGRATTPPLPPLRDVHSSSDDLVGGRIEEPPLSYVKTSELERRQNAALDFAASYIKATRSREQMR